MENSRKSNHLGDKKSWVITVVLCFIFLFGDAISGLAQRPVDFGRTSTPNNGNQPETPPEDTGPDSTVYQYVLTDNIYKKTSIEDTLADIAFMRNNMRHTQLSEYIQTGNFGSAVSSLIYKPKVNSGFVSGYDQYHIYHVKLNNFRFFEQNRPISDVYFSQIGSQENINVRANFSRNFRSGLSISLNYMRISQKGFYTGQNLKNTAFGIGMRYKSASDKYNVFLVFMHNANEEAHIGGIVNPNDLTLKFKKDIAVILSQSDSRQQEREMALIQYYKLTESKKSGFKLYLKNDILYKPSYFKFSDVSISDANDTLFYKGITLDKRGLRRYTDVDQVSNAFFINGEKEAGVKGRLGLTADFFTIKDGLDPIKRLDLTGSFDGVLPIFGSLQLLTKARLGLGKNIGNFDVSGTIDLKVKNIGTLDGFVRFYRSENPYNTSRLIINDIKELDTTFVHPVGTELGGEMFIKKLNLKVGLSQNVVNSPVYWNDEGRPSQYEGVFTASHLIIEQKLKVGKFHFDNQAHLQVFNQNLYALPGFYSSHQLYYAGTWFKKALDVHIGIDARLINAYNGPSFQPLYGAFHSSNSELPFFPASNVFLLARVSAFRAMLMMENFSQYFRSDTNFDVIGHPQFDPKFRFGFQWLLKD
jgi:hypothetical protein